MTITYYYKDHCRIYWRVECTASGTDISPCWDVEVFRSLDDFDDPEAQQVFRTSILRTGDTVDTSLVVAEMGRYYMAVLLGMARHLQGLYEPEAH